MNIWKYSCINETFPSTITGSIKQTRMSKKSEIVTAMNAKTNFPNIYLGELCDPGIPGLRTLR